MSDLDQAIQATVRASQAADTASQAAMDAVATINAASAAAKAERFDKQYYYLEDIVGNINGDCLEIKKWSVTSASVIALIGQIGVGNLAAVLALVAVLALAFWITEAIWRKNQAAFICHIREMEAQEPTLRISTRWALHYMGNETKMRSTRIMARFFSWETMLPHVFIFAIAALISTMLFAGAWSISTGPREAQSVVVEQPIEVRVVR